MFEIDDPQRRKTFLAKLGGVEETAFLEVEGERVVGKPEADVDRTTADGKASSVQFIHFLFTDAQVAEFKKPGTRVVLGFAHPEYGHMTILPEDRSAEHTSELQSLMRISYAVFCLKKKIRRSE